MTLSRRDFLVGGGTAVAGMTVWSFTAPALGQGAEIRVAIPADTSNNLPAMIAYSLGYFKDEGLTVKVPVVGGGANVRPMIASGQIQYSMGDVAHPLAITGAGKKSKILLVIDKRPTVANVMVRKDLWDKGIKTVEAIGNMKKPDGSKPKIGVTRIGSATWFYGNYIFTKVGLADKVNFVAVGDGSPMLGAFRTGQIDAVMANFITYLAVIDEKMGAAAFDINDKPTWDKFFGGDIPSQCLFAMEEQIKAQPKMTQGVTNAIYRALKYIEKTPAKELYAAINGKFLASFPAALATREIDMMKPAFDFNAVLTEANYKNGGTIWFSAGNKIAPQPYAEMVDFSFLEAAKKKFG